MNKRTLFSSSAVLASALLLTAAPTAHAAPPPAPRSPRTVGGAVLVSTGTLLGGFAIPIGVLMRRNAVDDGRYAESTAARRSARARRAGGTAFIVLGAAGSAAMIAAGVTLIVQGVQRGRAPREGAAVRPRIVPHFGPESTGLSLVGRF